MPLPIIGNVFRCAFQWVGASGLTAVSVLHVRNDTGTDAEVFAAIDAASDVEMFGALNSSTNCIATTITKLDGTSAGSVWPAPTGFSGAGSGEAIAQAACIVSFGTGQRGPRGRGRVFLPFVAEGEQQAGFIAGSRVTSVTDAWAQFVIDMATDDDQQLCVASYVHADEHDVTSTICKNVTGTIKARNDRQRP